MWQYLRIDHLPPGARCTFCGRELRRGKGIIVADSSGQEHFSGPACAKEHVGEAEERILDISRIALCVVVKSKKAKSKATVPPASSVPNVGNEKPSTPPLPPLNKVETYVRLRCEMMPDFKLHASAVLKEAFEVLERDGKLPEHLLQRISGLMRNADRDNSIFSDANVRRCVAVQYWISVALDHTREGRQDFLRGIQSALHSRWLLTQSQISGLNSWGQKVRSEVDDFPLLMTDAFDGVTVPDFMQGKRSGK